MSKAAPVSFMFSNISLKKENREKEEKNVLANKALVIIDQ